MTFNIFQQNPNSDHVNGEPGSDVLDLNVLATVLIVCGLISLMTAWVFSWNTQQVERITAHPSAGSQMAQSGAIRVRKAHEVYQVRVYADIPLNAWSFIQGQVLDVNKAYLFAFGKELWHERGRDSDGLWQAKDNKYFMNITFPKAGVYYLKFEIEGSRLPSRVDIKVSKKRGSHLPHLMFGIISLLAGLVMAEIRNRLLVRLVQGL